MGQMLGSLRPFSGAVLVIASALFLGLLLWQISQLNGGLSPTAVDRYRLAVRAADELTPAWEKVSDFRRSLVLGNAPPRPALRREIDARMRALDALFGAGGPAAAFDTGHDWPAAQKAWAAVRAAPPGSSALPLFLTLSRHIDMLLFNCDNASGLNYDNPYTQNLAQVVFNLVPEGYDRVQRAVVEATLAVRNGGMSLRERLAFSGTLLTIQGDYDLSQDDVPGVARMLSRIMPSRAPQFAEIVPLEKTYESDGKAAYKLLYSRILLRERPTLDSKIVDSKATSALGAAQQIRYTLSRDIEAMAVVRGAMYGRRRLLVDIAYVAAGLLLAGLILLTAQIVSWRGREALRLAREESRRLAAELARQKAEEALRIAEDRGRELEAIASFDALTGVLNRRAFDRALGAAWETSEAHGHALGLVMIDIDHFKSFNDRYGHQAGDQCLQAIAQACADAVRGEDIFARYGGEEFAAIVPKATKEDLESIADRMRAAVSSLNIPHVTDAGHVTLSIGAAAIVASAAHSMHALIARADANLYRAKEAGRDRLILSEEFPRRER